MKETAENNLVVKSNALIQASYKLTLNEQRLVLLGVSMLDSRRPGIRPGFNQVEGIRITAEAYAERYAMLKQLAELPYPEANAEK